MDHRNRRKTCVAGGCLPPRVRNSAFFFWRSDGAKQGPRRAFTGGPGFSRRAEVRTERNFGIFSTRQPARPATGLGGLQHMKRGAIEQAPPQRN
jgi:hypothetical protein